MRRKTKVKLILIKNLIDLNFFNRYLFVSLFTIIIVINYIILNCH